MRIRRRPFMFTGAVVLFLTGLVTLLALFGPIDESWKRLAGLGYLIATILMLTSIATGESRRANR